MTTPNKQIEANLPSNFWDFTGTPRSITTTYRYESQPVFEPAGEKSPDSPGLNKWAGLLTDDEWEYQCLVMWS